MNRLSHLPGFRAASLALAILPGLLLGGAPAPHQADPARGGDDAVLLDRLDRTFQLLSGDANRAYMDHFRDEPVKLAAVYYYAGLLAVSQGDRAAATQQFRRSAALAADSEFGKRSRCWTDPNPPVEFAAGVFERARMRAAGPQAPISAEALPDATSPEDRVHAAVAAARAGQADQLAALLAKIGVHPQLELERESSDAISTARCALFDPELLGLYARLATLRSGRAAAEPRDAPAAIQAATERLRTLRRQPAEQELSWRKFLDRHRDAVWALGWLYRCRGLAQQEKGDPAAARADYLRARTIGEALFPPSERGLMMEKFDPVFLAELGEVYARLGRYDLMLRYMYSAEGLPARFEPAGLVAHVARVAESLRLTRLDPDTSAQQDEWLPETLGEVLLGLPQDDEPAGFTPSHGGARRGPLGWLLVAAGSVVIVAAVAWRVARRPVG